MKAVMEIQFTFIFVLIAGAVILAFFFAVVQGQKGTSDIKLSGEILTRLDSILKGASVNVGTLTSIEGLPNTKLIFSCKIDEEPYYQIKKIKKSLPTEVVFAPETVKVKPGTPLMIWSLEWEYPFRTTYVTYITGVYTKYYFMDTPFLKSLYNDENKWSFPNNVIKELISAVDEIKDENYERIILVTNSADSELDSDIIQVVISGNDNTGTITINGDNTVYYGREMLLGAIFTADIESFNCNQDKAFKRMQKVAEVLENKTAELAISGVPSRCRIYYINAETMFSGITSLENAQANFYNINDLSLATINNDLEKASCPTIY
jgi:hypothetical protein